MEQFSGNYTGPYWSDGKFQESVAFGESEPLSQLDALSRLHDTAYATYKDRAHREAADLIYNEQATKLAGKFPELAGNLVLYGNYTARQAKQLAQDVALVPGMPLVGLVKHGISNLINSNRMVKGTYLKQERKDIEELYSRDPMKGRSVGNSHLAGKELRSLTKGLADGIKTTANFVKGVTSKIRSTSGNTRKDSKPVPETKEERAERLVQGQRRRMENYQNTYLNSLVESGVVKRKRKKKKNLHLATRVLADHQLREVINRKRN